MSNSLSMPGVGAGSVGGGGGLPSAGLGSMLSNDSDFPAVPPSAGSGLGRNGWRASDPGSIHHSVIGSLGNDEKEEVDLGREGSVGGKSVRVLFYFHLCVSIFWEVRSGADGVCVEGTPCAYFA